MRKNTIILIMLLMTVFAFNLYADSSLDGKVLFEKAKIKLFDRNWNSALEYLNEYIEDYQNERFYKKALFYRGKCFEELKMYNKALGSYENYSKVSNNKSLYEEANIAIIDISFKLSKNKNNYYIQKIVDYLENSEKIIRYYAAFRLSYFKNKKSTKASIPVLKNIIRKEKDQELVDRAKLALMRIDPKHLKSVNKTIDITNKNLNIRIFDKKKNKETLSLNIPFILAKLALEALPDEEKKLLKNKGYSIDSILETIINSGELFKFEVEDIIIKIWIE